MVRVLHSFTHSLTFGIRDDDMLHTAASVCICAAFPLVHQGADGVAAAQAVECLGEEVSGS